MKEIKEQYIDIFGFDVLTTYCNEKIELIHLNFSFLRPSPFDKMLDKKLECINTSNC